MEPKKKSEPKIEDGKFDEISESDMRIFGRIFVLPFFSIPPFQQPIPPVGVQEGGGGVSERGSSHFWWHTVSSTA